MKRCQVLKLGLVEYGEAWGIQKELFDDRSQNEIIDTLIILQHPSTYTFGRRTISGQPGLEENDINGTPIFRIDRGGGGTYHGPGQVVVYPVICLKSYTQDYHVYLRMLEDVIIRTLSGFMITGERLMGFTGVWVNGDKIASIGVRIIRGITMHGFSLNVNNDLRPFDYIVPCNIEDVRITSMSKVLGRTLNLSKIEEALIEHFAMVFDMVLENRLITVG